MTELGHGLTTGNPRRYYVSFIFTRFRVVFRVVDLDKKNYFPSYERKIFIVNLVCFIFDLSKRKNNDNSRSNIRNFKRQ